MQYEEYPYRPINPIQRNALPLLLIIEGMILVIFFSSLFGEQRESLVAFFAMVLFVVFIYPLAAIVLTTAHLSSSEDGVTVRLLWRSPIFIPWRAFGSSTIFEQKVSTHFRLLTFSNWHQVKLVYVPGYRKLELVGRMLGQGRTPVFVITPDHADGDRLLKRIEHAGHPARRDRKTLFRK
jgi:hypothetical protein